MRSFGSSGLALVLLLSVFLGAPAFELEELQPLIDEGVNVVAARRSQQGELPFRDFLYHQLPTCGPAGLLATRGRLRDYSDDPALARVPGRGLRAIPDFDG